MARLKHYATSQGEPDCRDRSSNKIVVLCLGVLGCVGVVFCRVAAGEAEEASDLLNFLGDKGLGRTSRFCGLEGWSC